LPPVLTREGQSILCLVLAAQLPSWASDFFVIAQPSKGEVSSRRFVTCGFYLQDNCPERVMSFFVMQANNLTLSILSIRFWTISSVTHTHVYFHCVLEALQQCPARLQLCQEAQPSSVSTHETHIM